MGTGGYLEKNNTMMGGGVNTEVEVVYKMAIRGQASGAYAVSSVEGVSV